ncbi:xanthine dehydrogenase molybdopterin binding subunit [Neiella marina]|uniref:Xanthine dehydrogenase molybdopterin binding subunit n=1 Tax=Neiella holothuriorum TaxID=2870530 RepID=A0ABS7EBU3_9GAMM|nr:xanthine dehydrogenase molybdopterin binding subunit [Neiella holothuriorum]MBW8189798.1 xanthine dehydrogenase molybdopterin binding subunit [Neiella holothuriorum]
MRKLVETEADRPFKSTGVGHSLQHESAIKHVTGRAQYIDDLPQSPQLLHVATGKSSQPYAKLTKVNLDAVRKAPGVVDVIVQQDIPGEVDVGPVYGGDPLLAGDTVIFVGQPIFAVAATSFEAAQRAVRLADIDYQPLSPVLTIDDALAAESFVLPPHQHLQGDPDQAIASAPHQIKGEIYVRGQEHFYLEGQISQAWPNEDGGIHVISSTQHPTEIQKLVAEVLDLPLHEVVAEVRRMGGGFGGKESQAAPLACMAALFAIRQQRPVRYRMPRQDDMVQTGKRHDFKNSWSAGFDDAGRLLGVDMLLAGKCGCSPDLSEGIVDRAMFHASNAYSFNSARVVGVRCKTNTVSNTAFRGFGGPKGMMAAETLMDDIARALAKDPLDVRLTNLYQPGQDMTPYGQQVTQHVLPDLMRKLADDADYRTRRASITEFNRSSQFVKKGLALTPVQFGISFTAKHLNQAGALLTIYTDGTMLISHGGTEMGQGLYTKIQQIVATAFDVPAAMVKVSSTRTDKVPNTSPTAASSGTDLNGMAALDACNQIKKRLAKFAAEHFNIADYELNYDKGYVHAGGNKLAFNEFVQLAYMNRISLAASGFYRTPKIHYDKATGSGQPFFYYANGAAAAEVSIDVLTGEYKVERIDILHDVGKSLNPAIDIGQIEGGFVQGMGWLTTEELLWDDNGHLMSNSPANYKIPTAFDVPYEFNVALYQQANQAETIHLSKAVGEPPLMLGIAVWSALRDAVASTTNYQHSPRLDTPATPERVFWALQDCAAFNRQQETP